MHISAYSAFSQQFVMCFFHHKNHVAEHLEPKSYVLFDGILAISIIWVTNKKFLDTQQWGHSLGLFSCLIPPLPLHVPAFVI